MARFYMTWEVDPTRMPVDAKERALLLSGMLEMVKQDGNIKDWGNIAGEGRGYMVVESSTADLITTTQKYYPFVEFETHPVLTVDEVAEGLKPLM